MTLFLTSDEHYFHSNIINLCNRKFSNVEEMHYELILRHNSVVTPTDIVIHLGDFSFKHKEIGAILRELNGSHSICLGNHDKAYKNPKLIDEYIEMGFKEVFKEKIVEIKSSPLCFIYFRIYRV